MLVFRSTFPSQSFARGRWQFCAQLQETKKDVFGKAANPCPTMNVHLEFVSHMFCPDTRLYYESSTSGRKDHASTPQQALRRPPNPGFDQPRIVMLQIYVFHTLFQYADRDFPPTYADKDHWQPKKNRMINTKTNKNQIRIDKLLHWVETRVQIIQGERNIGVHTW